MRARRIAVAMTMLFMVSCSSSTSPAPSPKSITGRSPVRSAADLNCSLPVRVGEKYGFVDFPSGRFRVDTSAPSPQQNSMGYLYAHGARRWVPVSYSFAEYQLSPDGTEMVAFEPVTGSARFSSAISLIDLRTSKSRHLASLPGPGVRILGYLPDGIYVYGGSIYRVDPATSKVTEIKPDILNATAGGSFFWVTSAYAWSSLIAGPNQGDMDSVTSISLHDGSVTTWYTAPATRSVSVLGFVAPDKPLVAEYNTEPYDRMTGVSFFLLTGPGASEKLSFDPSIIAWGVTDSFGVWLASPGHLWLYDSAGLFSMASVHADFVGIGGGFCR